MVTRKRPLHLSRSAIRLWAVCLMLALVRQVWADATQDTYRFSATLESIDQLRFKFPVYDYDGSSADTWNEGTIYIQVAGGNKETLLKFLGKYTGKDNGKPDIEISKGVDGAMVLKRMQDYSDVNVYLAPTTTTLPCEPGKTWSLGDVVWSVPRTYRGQRVTISWSVTRYVQKDNTGNSKSHATVYIESNDIDIPAAPTEMDPMLMQPILAFQGDHAGQAMIPWLIAANEVVKATLHYTDNTLEQDVTLTLTPTTSDMAYVPATHAIDNLYVEIDYKDSEGQLVSGRKSSPPISVPILHTAKHFTGQLRTDGKAQLDWRIDNLEREDIMDGDQWEIQRNLTGSFDTNDPNWETLSMEPFERSQEEYQFIDETLPKVYRNSMVTYRIRRLATADWGWTYETGQVLTAIMQRMYLPSVTQAHVDQATNWGEDYQHNVQLEWTMTDNADGDQADNTFYIRTADDWDTFAMMVNSGNNSISAAMLADVTLDETAHMVGSSENTPFAGTFDGNGHTLTVKFADTQRRYVAPFSYVGGATIRNLHVMGTIDGGLHPAGLVGRGFAKSKNLIENCRVSATICSWDTNAHVGGFIGHNGSAATTLNNCLFDGSLEAKSYSNNSYAAPFIGWEDGGTHNKVTNNLENGSYNTSFAHTAPNYYYSPGGAVAYGNNSTNTNNYSAYDTFSSLLKVGGTRVFVNDIDGNRYEIPDLEALDHKSFKKIELFL